MAACVDLWASGLAKFLHFLFFFLPVTLQDFPLLLSSACQYSHLNLLFFPIPNISKLKTAKSCTNHNFCFSKKQFFVFQIPEDYDATEAITKGKTQLFIYNISITSLLKALDQYPRETPE